MTEQQNSIADRKTIVNPNENPEKKKPAHVINISAGSSGSFQPIVIRPTTSFSEEQSQNDKPLQQQLQAIGRLISGTSQSNLSGLNVQLSGNDLNVMTPEELNKCAVQANKDTSDISAHNKTVIENTQLTKDKDVTAYIVIRPTSPVSGRKSDYSNVRESNKKTKSAFNSGHPKGINSISVAGKSSGLEKSQQLKTKHESTIENKTLISVRVTHVNISSTALGNTKNISNIYNSNANLLGENKANSSVVSQLAEKQNPIDKCLAKHKKIISTACPALYTFRDVRNNSNCNKTELVIQNQTLQHQNTSQVLNPKPQYKRDPVDGFIAAQIAQSSGKKIKVYKSWRNLVNDESNGGFMDFVGAKQMPDVIIEKPDEDGDVTISDIEIVYDSSKKNTFTRSSTAMPEELHNDKENWIPLIVSEQTLLPLSRPTVNVEEKNSNDITVEQVNGGYYIQPKEPEEIILMESSEDQSDVDIDIENINCNDESEVQSNFEMTCLLNELTKKPFCPEMLHYVDKAMLKKYLRQLEINSKIKISTLLKNMSSQGNEYLEEVEENENVEEGKQSEETSKKCGEEEKENTTCITDKTIIDLSNQTDDTEHLNLTSTQMFKEITDKTKSTIDLPKECTTLKQTKKTEPKLNLTNTQMFKETTNETNSKKADFTGIKKRQKEKGDPVSISEKQKEKDDQVTEINPVSGSDVVHSIDSNEIIQELKCFFQYKKMEKGDGISDISNVRSYLPTEQSAELNTNMDNEGFVFEKGAEDINSQILSHKGVVNNIDEDVSIVDSEEDTNSVSDNEDTDIISDLENESLGGNSFSEYSEDEIHEIVEEIIELSPSDVKKDHDVEMIGEVSKGSDGRNGGWILLNRYGCVLCDFVALTMEAVREHWITVHFSNNPYKCYYCKVGFSSSFDVYLHIKIQHSCNAFKYIIETDQHYLNEIQVDTDIFIDHQPKASTKNLPKAPYVTLPGVSHIEEVVGLYKKKKDIVSVGYKKVNGTYDCSDCTYKTVSMSRLVSHYQMEHLEGLQSNYQLNRHQLCEWCKKPVTQSHQRCRKYISAREINFQAMANKMAEIAGIDFKASRDGKVLDNFVTTLNWKEAWDVCLITGQPWFICQFCQCYSPFKADMFDHILEEHPFPEMFICGFCLFQGEVTDEDRVARLMRCYKCDTTYNLLQLQQDDSCRFSNSAVIVPNTELLCRLCGFISPAKNTLVRHIMEDHEVGQKYYACAFCNFVGGYIATVILHMENMHFSCPNNSAVEKVLTMETMSSNYEDLIEEIKVEKPKKKLQICQTYSDKDETEVPIWKAWLYDHMVNKVKKGTMDIDVSLESLLMTNEPRPTVMKRFRGKLNKYAKKLHEGGQQSGDGESIYNCPHCEFKSTNWNIYLRHIDTMHGRTAEELRKNKEKVFEGDHFQCLACLYRCFDRSCMTRHVKYMHLQRFAHWCPYCRYGNVEKTKVRMHVAANHSSMPCKVRTDERALVEMIDAVKDFYVKIDKNGRKIHIARSKYRQGAGPYIVKRGNKAGPRAKALEKILKFRTANTIENTPTSSPPSTDYVKYEPKLEVDIDGYGQYPLIKKNQLIVLNIDPGHNTASVATKSGVVSVNYTDYIPKSEIKMEKIEEQLTGQHVEGLDFEAYDIPWNNNDTDSEASDMDVSEASDSWDQIEQYTLIGGKRSSTPKINMMKEMEVSDIKEMSKVAFENFKSPEIDVETLTKSHEKNFKEVCEINFENVKEFETDAKIIEKTSEIDITPEQDIKNVVKLPVANTNNPGQESLSYVQCSEIGEKQKHDCDLLDIVNHKKLDTMVKGSDETSGGAFVNQLEEQGKCNQSLSEESQQQTSEDQGLCNISPSAEPQQLTSTETTIKSHSDNLRVNDNSIKDPRGEVGKIKQHKRQSVCPYPAMNHIIRNDLKLSAKCTVKITDVMKQILNIGDS